MDGTLVLFHSFLNTNPWFKGDLVVIHDGLRSDDQEKFALFGERIKFVPVSAQCKNSLDNLLIRCPDYSKSIARFHSIEAFQLTDYDKVLFCDSDVMFCGGVEELFSVNFPICACADGPNLRNKKRDWVSFKEVSLETVKALSNTFNAGFMVLDRSVLTPKIYDSFLAILDGNLFSKIQTGHTDQVLYNFVFQFQCHILDPGYNVLLAHVRDGQDAKFGLDSPRTLHFNGPAKPWLPDKIAQANTKTMAAAKLWLACRTDYFNLLNA